MKLETVRRGFRPDAKSQRQLARVARRFALPSDHHLSDMIPSLPERISICRDIQSDDTPENRFVKFALKVFVGFLNKMRRKLDEKDNNEDMRLRGEITALEREIEASLGAEIFRSVSDPDMLPLGSPVLHRKEGYREIYLAWLKFDMAARLVWQGGDDVYGAGQRDVAMLYEYWVFFRLLRIVSEVFRLSHPLVESLIEKTFDGFGLKLKSGEHLAFDGQYAGGSRPLRVRFSYNRTFSRESKIDETGSWTERLRPDYTLSLWPADFGEIEAEQQELMVHVHFDAKYRIDSIEQMFGRENVDIDDEKKEQREGRYKRGDLLKMHAYRDAIRRTQGAYILYPGDITKRWRGYHEILPGLGAFPIKPGYGDAEIAQFIREVVSHVCDRATACERLSYHVYQIEETPPPYCISRALPERAHGALMRPVPIAETFVLVGWCKSEEHLA